MPFFATAGSKVYIGGVLAMKSSDFAEADFASQTFVEINNLETIGSLGDTAAAVTQSIIGEARDKTVKGTRNAGTMELVSAINYSDAGQIALLAAEKTTFDYAFKIEFNDKPAVVSAAVTMSLAAPGVVTWNAHGLAVNDAVSFSTTGALLTGLTVGTTYYVKTVLDANTFTVAATKGGAAINTSGTQSGVHTGTTVPSNSQRLFIGKVMSASEALDQANSVMKLNASIAINSNIVRISAAQ